MKKRTIDEINTLSKMLDGMKKDLEYVKARLKHLIDYDK